MIVGFSKHGTGKASRALGYMLAEQTSNRPLDYLLGETNRRGARRTPAPLLLRGDASIARRLIDTSPHRWKYTSGVLSFSAGEQITPQMEQKIMDDFETTAFAGLSPQRYHIIWIRHAHLGREEMHFLVPRLELHTGRSLNIAPPGRASRRLFDTWRSVINSRYGLSDPDDPARRVAVSLPDHVAKLKDRPGQTRAAYIADVRETLTRFVEAKARDGLVKDRADVVRILQQSGFAIPRNGSTYITVQHPTTGERFRLRGMWYEDKTFSPAQRSVSSRLVKPADPKRAAELARRLEPLRQARADYHLQRYGRVPIQPQLALDYDRARNAPAFRGEETGRRISGQRQGPCQQAKRLDHSARNLERASQRFGRAHRAFAHDYESLLTRTRRRSQVKVLLRRYALALNSAGSREDIELEREIEL